MNDMELVAYLRSEARRPFALGRADCVTLIADWVALRRGVDPMADYRGGYADPPGAEAHLRASGGLLRIVGRNLRRAGLRMTRTPADGDVAIIVAARVVSGAIRRGETWVSRTHAGLAMYRADYARVVASWAV